MSIESVRSKAYSSDLRWHMVYQWCVMGLSYAVVAKRLNVDPTIVASSPGSLSWGGGGRVCSHEINSYEINSH